MESFDITAFVGERKAAGASPAEILDEGRKKIVRGSDVATALEVRNLCQSALCGWVRVFGWRVVASPRRQLRPALHPWWRASISFLPVDCCGCSMSPWCVVPPRALGQP